MKIVLILMFLAIPMIALGSPFLVCDPYPVIDGVDSFGVTINGAPAIDSLALVGGDGTTSLYYDLGTLPSGLYEFAVTARRSSDLTESAPSPFSWTKGEALSSPTSIRLMR